MLRCLLTRISRLASVVHVVQRMPQRGKLQRRRLGRLRRLRRGGPLDAAATACAVQLHCVLGCWPLRRPGALELLVVVAAEGSGKSGFTTGFTSGFTGSAGKQRTVVDVVAEQPAAPLYIYIYI